MLFRSVWLNDKVNLVHRWHHSVRADWAVDKVSNDLIPVGTLVLRVEVERRGRNPELNLGVVLNIFMLQKLSKVKNPNRDSS